ncbi:MAG: tetratricopeptide repeat protein, partial [Methanosarcinaceae archaeon]|nr:tetratricopeptide repeat protein [Methanosarcinaceae archaeon]
MVDTNMQKFTHDNANNFTDMSKNHVLLRDRLYPEKASNWSLKGHALYDLEKYEEAIEAFDRAIELDPKDAFNWNFKGNALYDLEKYEEAIKAFDKAIELDPEDAINWNLKGHALYDLE